jgi:hypothetical protein
MLEKTYRGLCQTPGCGKKGRLTWYKQQFVCRDCVIPPDPPQHAVDFLKQSESAYTPENTPMPGFTQADIVTLRKRRLSNWGRGKRKREAHAERA